jgi:hypothetical protein
MGIPGIVLAGGVPIKRRKSSLACMIDRFFLQQAIDDACKEGSVAANASGRSSSGDECGIVFGNRR